MAELTPPRRVLHDREAGDCCEPEEKDGCCTPGSRSCGCSAGQRDVRERVRERAA